MAAFPLVPALSLMSSWLSNSCWAVIRIAHDDAEPLAPRRTLSVVNDSGTGRLRGGSNKCDGISMDSLITAAARALAAGDPLGALNRVALRDDAPALALRGIAMAQLGDLAQGEDAAAERRARLRPERGGGARAMRGRRGRDRARLARPGLAGEGARRRRARRSKRTATRQRRPCAATSRRAACCCSAASTRPSARWPSSTPRRCRLRRGSAHELVVAGIAMRRLRTKAARAALERAAQRRAAGRHPGARGRGRQRSAACSTRRRRA